MNQILKTLHRQRHTLYTGMFNVLRITFFHKNTASSMLRETQVGLKVFDGSVVKPRVPDGDMCMSLSKFNQIGHN